MARTLLIMRHGKSTWDETDVEDHDRSLAERGRRDARRMGAELRARGLAPDIILGSTAKRAHSTMRRVATASGYEGEIVERPELYFQGVEAYREALAALPAQVQTALVVGHNPLLEKLIQRLTGQSIPFPTAALACIDLPIATWAALGPETRGTLRLVLLPKELAAQSPGLTGRCDTA